MDNLKYIKGNIYEVRDKRSWTAFASRADGAISNKKPQYLRYSAKTYKEYCKKKKPQFVNFKQGEAYLTKDRGIFLMVSFSFAEKKENPEDIKRRMFDSLEHLKALLPKNAKVFSTRLNTDVFDVPWEKTEAQLKYFLLFRPDVIWTIVDPI